LSNVSVHCFYLHHEYSPTVVDATRQLVFSVCDLSGFGCWQTAMLVQVINGFNWSFTKVVRWDFDILQPAERQQSLFAVLFDYLN
jgi:hypothetical protein